MASQHLRSNFDPVAGIAAYTSLPAKDKPALSARQVGGPAGEGQFTCVKCGGAFPMYYGKKLPASEGASKEGWLSIRRKLEDEQWRFVNSMLCGMSYAQIAKAAKATLDYVADVIAAAHKHLFLCEDCFSSRSGEARCGHRD